MLHSYSGIHFSPGKMILLFFLPMVWTYAYLSEPPVKLMTASLFGEIFPASDSDFRVSSTGEDHDIQLSQLEEANQMPHKQLVLPPGGTAMYSLPCIGGRFWLTLFK